MPTREEMSNLAKEIVGSYADRIATIADLRETVKLELQESRTHLQELRDSRIATGKEIRADLARGAANRKHEVGSMLSVFSAELKELNSGRNAMSKELKAKLARSVADCKRGVGAMLNSFSQARTAMSKEMRAELAKGVTDRKHEVRIMKRNVGTMLKGFNGELKEIRSALAGGQAEWQILTTTMQAKRGGVAVEVKLPVKKITPEATELRGQVFEYLANHLDGTRLVELEEEFGVTRIEMARLLKDLMDENKVEKRGLLYSAI